MATFRLPLADERPTALPELPDARRLPLGPKSVVLVAVHGETLAASLDTLRAALGSAAIPFAELHVAARKREGVEWTPPSLRADLASLPAAIARATAELAPESTFLLASGAPLVALRAATTTVLLTGGASPSEWPADVRSIRTRFDLLVPALDLPLSRELVMRISAHG